MRSPKLAALTLKRLAAESPLVRAAVVAITLVPLLYGALYLWAFWDPYGRLDKMPVALVNLDVPATVDSETISAGADLTETLVETGTVDWHVVSADEASAGLAAGRYYLALTIPSDFSAKLATANSRHPEQARLHVVAQESSNMLASQIASRVFGEVRAAAAESASKGYLDTIYVGFADTRRGLHDAADGADTLASGLSDARTGARALAAGAHRANAGASSLASGLVRLSAGAAQAYVGASTIAIGNASLAAGLGDAASGAKSLSAGAEKLAAGASSARTGAEQVASGTSSLSAGLSAANSGAAKVAGGAGALDSGAGQLSAATGSLAAGAAHLASSAGDLAAGAAKLLAGVRDAVSQLGAAAHGAEQVAGGAAAVDSALHAYLDAHPEAASDPDFATALGASAQVKSGSADLAHGLAGAASGGNALADGAEQVADGAAQLHAGADSLAAGAAAADTGARGLASGAHDLAGGASALSAGVGDASTGAKRLATGSAELAVGTSALAAGASDVASGSAALARGVGSARSGALQLAAGSSTLASGTHTLATGSEQAASGAVTLAAGLVALDDGTGTLASGLAPAVSGSRELESGLTAGTEKITRFSTAEQDANAEMMSNPVALDTVRRGEVPTYGTGFAPYFIPLALWVGALLVYFLIKPLPDRAVAANAPAAVIAFAGYLPAAIIGVAQAVVLLVVVQFALGLSPVAPLAYYGFGIVTALAFVAILQMLNAAFGVVGKLLSIILLMLQLTSAGGTFPIQMVPAFFQTASPYLPMTYVVSGLRQAISGGDIRRIVLDAAVLLGFAALSLAITTVAAARSRTYTMERLHPSLEL